jgi:hypothetical protein
LTAEEKAKLAEEELIKKIESGQIGDNPEVNQKKEVNY